MLLVCDTCKQEVSGPNKKSVRETMDRHLKETNHKLKAAAK